MCVISDHLRMRMHTPSPKCFDESLWCGQRMTAPKAAALVVRFVGQVHIRIGMLRTWQMAGRESCRTRMRIREFATTVEQDKGGIIKMLLEFRHRDKCGVGHPCSSGNDQAMITQS